MRHAWEARDVSTVIRLVRWNTDLSLMALVKLTGLAQSTLSDIVSGKVELKKTDKINTALEGLRPLPPSHPPLPPLEERADTHFLPFTHQDAFDLEEMAHALSVLERDYTTTSSTPLLARAGQLHGRLIRAVFDGDPTAQGLRARSNLLMGKLVWDASQRRETHTSALHLDEAITISRAIGDHTTLAHALLRRAFIPLYSPPTNSQLALITARRAMTTAEQDPALQALAALHVSEAHARLDNPRDAEKHLEHADDLARSVAGLNSRTWQGRRLRIAGSVYLALDEPARARPVLEQAVGILEDRPKSHGIALANLALTHVRLEEIDGAVATLQHAMDTAHSTHGGGATPLIAAAVRELTPWRTTPVVADVQDLFIDLLTR